MRAYVTLLSNRNYLEGVLVLNETLKQVQSKYPFYCLLSLGVEEEVISVLEKKGIRYIRLDKKVFDGVVSSNSKQADWDYSNWNYTFDKLQIWGLVQFEKMVFLDSDMIVTNNIDHLFDCKPFTASLAGVLFPTNHDIHILNSGLMVVEPSKEIEEEMIQIAKVMIPEMQAKNLPLGDQDVINAYFPDWFEHKDLILDDGYNLYAHYLQSYMRHERYAIDEKGKRKINVIHFVGKEKPWMMNSCSRFIKMCFRMFPNVYYMIACWKYLKILKKVSV